MAGRTDILTSRLSALAEPMRLEIMFIISEAGTCCASDILSHFDITQPTLSHHMSVLISNDLVIASKQGRYMRYSVNNQAVSELKEVIDMLSGGKPVTREVPKTPKKIDKKKDKDKDKDKKKKKNKKKKK